MSSSNTFYSILRYQEEVGTDGNRDLRRSSYKEKGRRCEEGDTQEMIEGREKSQDLQLIFFQYM